MRKIGKTRDDAGWFLLKDAARRRAGGRCEYCGGVIGEHSDLHHRWYTFEDSLEMLMLVHRRCHAFIHFGGRMNVAAGSLAAEGDRGKGDTPQWRRYLKERTNEN